MCSIIDLPLNNGCSPGDNNRDLLTIKNGRIFKNGNPWADIIAFYPKRNYHLAKFINKNRYMREKTFKIYGINPSPPQS